MGIRGKTERTELSEGRTVAVEVIPEGSSPDKVDYVVFFLHGSMANRRQFQGMFDGLFHVPEGKKEDINFMCVCYDALGCGESEKPYDTDAYTVDKLVADASAIFDKYAKPDGGNIVLGHSFGTTVCARIRHTIKAPVAATLLLGTAHTMATPIYLFWLPLWILNLIRQQLSDGFLEKAFSPATPMEERVKLQDATGIKNEMYAVKFFYNTLCWASDEDWSALQGPALIIQGADDAITTPEAAEDLYEVILKEAHKASKYATYPFIRFSKLTSPHITPSTLNLIVRHYLLLTLPHPPTTRFVRVHGAGHQVHMEQPGACVSAMQGFLKDAAGIELRSHRDES